MKMFEQTGEFKPDHLIAGNEFPILTEGIGLKAGYGLLKRGTLIMKGSDKAGYAAGTAVQAAAGEGESAAAADMEMKVFGILTDDFDTGTDKAADNIPATAYQTGMFNRAAVIVAGEDGTAEDYEDELKQAGLYLRNVQNYE